ncbi:MAG: hypothetical protein J6U33_06275 [Paludibacteraceae bacterium]|nr:hypothetical protein [Paludibacteraceae bacterium]
MEDNKVMGAIFTGAIVLIALVTILMNGCVGRKLQTYRGGIPQGLFVKYELVEQTDTYRLYKSKDGRTHRIERPQIREQQPSDDDKMPVFVGGKLMVL